MPPQRCIIDQELTGIECNTLLQNDNSTVFDYPTFNPLYKMNPQYQWTYAIAPVSSSSQWFDRIIKIHSPTGTIAASWSEENVYVSEADFVPVPDAASEDDGLLLSVLYNSTSDASSLMVFNATSLAPMLEYKLVGVVPFHAHGLVCVNSKCYTNP